MRILAAIVIAIGLLAPTTGATAAETTPAAGLLSLFVLADLTPGYRSDVRKSHKRHVASSFVRT